jgi:cell division septation protein DedD
VEDYEGTIHERSDRGDREVSYYELALTNRQVFVAIVLLLIGLSGAFLAGAWFGSGAGSRPAAQQAATPVPAPAKPSGEQLDEYRFFSEKQAARSPQSSAPAESAAPSAPSDSSSASPRPEAVTAKPPAAVPIPAPEPSTRTAPAPSAPAPVPSAPATSPARVAPEPAAAPKPATPSSPAGDLWVQVFSTADAAQARRVADQLSGAGYRAVVSRGGAAGGAPLERVRVGPFRDRAEAQRVADDVRRKLKFSTWITSTQ